MSEEHNYPFGNKKKLDKEYRDFGEQQMGQLLRLNMNDIYLRRLLPKDYIEGFQHAMGNVSKKYRQAHQDQTIIYEIVEKPKDTFFHASMWLIVLLIEAILLTIAFRLALDKKEYDEIVSDIKKIKSFRKFKSFISSFLKHKENTD